MGYVEDLRKIVGHRPLILVGAVTVLVDESGRILLEQRRFPKESWGLPGGLMELGESTEDVARREVMEETGLTVKDLQLINVYSGPNHFVVAENGDEFFVVTVAYYTKNFEGNLRVDETESISFQFYDPKNLPQKMVKSHKAIIEEYLKNHSEQ
ncbi:ADP-ribose pyrophosphatase YjhB, NUDIX family [Mesobacillus persicus]|uniref:ADP-ribose pyrophosphatase YjhB, NUDIX family n=1 Tax=Mesobacillus persicus TaxID=930146 RepID=A0A1H8H1S6_9BACI|nr:NUDIX hydrolase [Mesobacillus persicus]SEN49969.1 ADP-ribose pyrophosphatase YjhB, NUDIX family [Mesobacillus persicus]